MTPLVPKKRVHMLETFSSVFRNTVNVLVVDDESEILQTIKELLDLFGVYNVTTAANTKQALEKISRNQSRFHACALDLCLADVEKNEYYLMDKYGKTIPFIVISGRQDTEKGIECGRRGAKAFASKGKQSFYREFISSLNKYALINLICPLYNESQKDLLSQSLEMLVATNPQSVSEWARTANITERQLHREWKERLGINPLHALYVYRLYSALFACIQKEIAATEPAETFTMEEAVKFLLKSDDYRKTFEYYLLHKRQISSFLMSPVLCA
jgi:CheY-like chemotaxis protein